MKRAVLVVLASKNYIDQAKALFSAAYWNAGWKGDYLLLAHEMTPDDAKWFLDKGILVKFCPTISSLNKKLVGTICLSKFYMFTEYFKQWEHVVYLDADIIIRGSIDGILDIHGFGACHSLGQTVKDILIDLKQIDKGLLAEITTNYDLNNNSFNAGVLSFSTDIIKETLCERLTVLFERYANIVSFDDQSILNLYFNRVWKELSPVYNRTIEKSAYSSIDPDKFEGIIIHTVSLGDGPWNPDNIFHKEWLENFKKADLINFSNIPNIEPWPKEKIEQQSRNIIKAHVWGHDRNIFSFLKKAIMLILTKPSRAFVKIKQFLNMLIKESL